MLNDKTVRVWNYENDPAYFSATGRTEDRMKAIFTLSLLARKYMHTVMNCTKIA